MIAKKSLGGGKKCSLKIQNISETWIIALMMRYRQRVIAIAVQVIPENSLSCRISWGHVSKNFHHYIAKMSSGLILTHFKKLGDVGFNQIVLFRAVPKSLCIYDQSHTC